MLLVIFVNITYICILVYIFRTYLFDCFNYESVHIKNGIDLKNIELQNVY